eukprot:scaffold14717_cov168-Ochromonas_danica.AAC.9
MPHPEMVTVGTYLARRLVQAGVGHYFTVPGDFTLSLLDEFLLQDNLNMIGCCNELNAAYAADGYARSTGGLAAVCVTYMVGGLSAINGVAGAYSDDLPVLLISGGPNYCDAHERHIIHHTIGEVDIYQQSKCYEPIVAKTLVARHHSDCARMIDDAIHTALTKRKPVYLEIPVNLSTFKIPAPIDWSSPADLPKPYSDPATLSAAKDAILASLNASVKPVLLAGSKLRKSQAVDEFIALADQVGAGVAVMPDAKGLFPETHPNFMGRYWGSVSNQHVAEVVESADLVVAAGPVLNDYTTTGWSALLSTNKMIVLGPDYVKIGPSLYPNVQLGDILREITSDAPNKPGSLQTYQRYALAGPVDAPVDVDPKAPLNLRFLKDTVEKSLTADTTVMTETGDAWFIGQSFKLPEGAKYHVQMQYGSIGWSVGALLGLAMAEGESRRVIALIGDGSFQMTAQELSTMIRYNVRCTIILLNNMGYTIEVQIHDGAYNDTKNWDYAGLVNTFNAEDGNGLGIKARTCEEFVDALAQSEKHDGVCLIEAFLDRDDCTKELLEWGSRVCKANGRR